MKSNRFHANCRSQVMRVKRNIAAAATVETTTTPPPPPPPRTTASACAYFCLAHAIFFKPSVRKMRTLVFLFCMYISIFERTCAKKSTLLRKVLSLESQAFNAVLAFVRPTCRSSSEIKITNLARSVPNCYVTPWSDNVQSRKRSATLHATSKYKWNRWSCTERNAPTSLCRTDMKTSSVGSVVHLSSDLLA